MDINKVMLVGTLPNDPEPVGKSAVRFLLVTTRKVEGKVRVLPTSHRVAAHGKLADVIKQYVVKGQKVYVEGRLAGSLVVADNLIMLSRGRQAA